MNEKNKISALAQVLAAAHQHKCKECEKQRESLEKSGRHNKKKGCYENQQSF